jgi:hypothetical protein
MLKKIIAAAAVVGTFTFPAPTPAEHNGRYQWKLQDSEENCQTYTSAVAGKDYIAAKSVCTIPARIDVVGMLLRDIANFPKWMEDCKETKLLRVVDGPKDVFLFWFRQHVPLFADRDMVLKTETDIRPGRTAIKAYSSREAAYEAGEGYVRMPSFMSEFTLEWVDREHTKVTFMIDPDLGDGLPRGPANSSIKKIPLRSLLGMAKMVKQPKYVETARGSAYENATLEGMQSGTLH